MKPWRFCAWLDRELVISCELTVGTKHMAPRSLVFRYSRQPVSANLGDRENFPLEAIASLLLAAAVTMTVLCSIIRSPDSAKGSIDAAFAEDQPGNKKTKEKPTEPVVGRDLNGDPLPAEALARMGEIRFRHGAAVRAVVFSSDGRSLVSAGDDDTIRIWETRGKEICSFKGNHISIHAVSFSPDGRTLASGGFDKTVRLWDTATGKETRALHGHQDAVYSVAFSPDSRTLASASEDKTIRLWEIASGKEIRALQGHIDEVRSVAFSVDAKTLASASLDGTVRLWQTATGKEICVLQGHQGRVSSVAFSPDGKILASVVSTK